MRCIIIEDEKPIREELEYILNQYLWIEVVGCAGDGLKGLELIDHLKPEVVFLDIQMPGLSGIEVASKLRYLERQPLVVFTTAYKDHALKAFDLGAVDYLLKPYDEERIHVTLKRIQERLGRKRLPLEDVNPASDEKDRLPVLQRGKTLIAQTSEFCYCVSQNSTVYIHTNAEEYQSTYTLNELQDRTQMFRIHKSYLVNLKRIREVYSWFNGTYQIILDNPAQTVLTVSRSYVKSFKKAIGLS